MLDLQLHSDGERAVVARLSGELIASEVPDLTESLQEAATGHAARLAIDLSGLTMLDSSGLAALIQLTNRARLTSGKVVLVNPSPFVTGVFRTTRLDRWFDIASDLPAARMVLSEP